MADSIVCPVCGMSTRLVTDGVVSCANPFCDSNLPPITLTESDLTSVAEKITIAAESGFDDTRAMDLIAEYMSGHEWSADTLDEIAGVVIASGREIKDPFDAS